MITQIQSYISFLTKSSNQHGVHSPFVYNLITKCLYSKKQHKEYQILLQYKQNLYSNNSKISIKDYGAGSKNLNNSLRKINAIAKNAGISTKRNQLLFRIIQYFDSKSILEIGTSLGIATSALALANKNSVVTSLEGCPETANIASNALKKYNINNVNIIVGEFSETLSKVIINKTFDLIFFDGNHQKQPTIDYFEMCLPHTHNNSVFIFDDIYWSKEMTEAWNHIKNHEKVTISIDTFQWGIVFFRKEQSKQHFTIRI